MSKNIKEFRFLIFFVFFGLAAGSVVFSSNGKFLFGGRITATQECTCSEGSQVTVQGFGINKRFNGTFLYLPIGTKLVGSKSKVEPSRTIIGYYSSGGSCLITGDPCTELPISKGTMTKVKTN